MVCCALSSLSQHHGMTFQSHGSGEITQSKQVFSQHDTNFQLRRNGPVREELHISVSHPSKLPSDATSLLTDMSLFPSLPSGSVPHSPILPTSATCVCCSVKPYIGPPLPAKPTGVPAPCSNKTSLFKEAYPNLLAFSWSLWQLAPIKGAFAIFPSPHTQGKVFPSVCPLALRGMFPYEVTVPAPHPCTGTCKHTSCAPAQSPSAHCPSLSVRMLGPVAGVCPGVNPHLLLVAALVAGSPLIPPLCPDSCYFTFPRNAGTGFPVMLDEYSHFLDDSVTSGKYLSFWNEIEMYTSSHQPK